MSATSSGAIYFPIFLAGVPVVGYLAISLIHLTRFAVYRQSGQAQFFISSIAGVLLLIVARIITVIFEQSSSQWIAIVCQLWAIYAPFPYSGTLFCSAIFAFFLPIVLNRIWGRQVSATIAAGWHGDLVEGLLQDCMERDELVELTLHSGKCYVGFVQNSGIASMGESDVSIIPLASGYRVPKTKELKLKTFYDGILEEVKNAGLKEDDLRIVFPISEVISARLFSPDVYLAFYSKNLNVPTD